MAQTIYASFADATQCEQAAGALLDYGVRREDISLVTNPEFQRNNLAQAQNDVYVSGDTAASYSGDTMGAAAQAGLNPSGNAAPASMERPGVDVAGQPVSANAYGQTFEEAEATRAAVADQGYRGGEIRGTGAVLDRPSGNHMAEVDSGDIATTTSLNDNLNHVYPTYAAGATGSGDVLSYGDPVTADRVAGSTASDLNNDATGTYRSVPPSADIEGAAKQGISVTTPADSAAGAAKGAGIGLGLGILAGIAALAVPGIGWVVGGGALATAIGGVLGTTIAGAVAGGVTGYLKDQGVPEHVATEYNNAILQGGAMLAVHVPSGKIDSVAAEQVLRKYGASNVNVY